MSQVYKECSRASVYGNIIRVSRFRTAKMSSKRYFTAEVSDGEETLKIVCDDHRFKTKLERFQRRNVAVTIEDCSITQSTHPTTRGNFELRSNEGTKLYENPKKKFNIRNDSVYTHSTILDRLEDMKVTIRKQIVTVCGNFVSIEDPSEVTRRVDSVKFKMQECILADTSMAVKLKIWEEDIGKVLKGSSYRFINVKVKVFDGEWFLSTTEDSEITKIEDITGEMSAEMMPSDYTEIQGRVSTVKSVIKYTKCPLCSSRVKAVNHKNGRCKRCHSSVKLSSCELSSCANFTIRDKTTGHGECEVSAFDEVLDLIIGGNFLCSEASESDIEDQLLDAHPATFMVNQDDVVSKTVKREI